MWDTVDSEHSSLVKAVPLSDTSNSGIPCIANSERTMCFLNGCVGSGINNRQHFQPFQIAIHHDQIHSAQEQRSLHADNSMAALATSKESDLAS